MAETIHDLVDVCLLTKCDHELHLVLLHVVQVKQTCNSLNRSLASFVMKIYQTLLNRKKMLQISSQEAVQY